MRRTSRIQGSLVVSVMLAALAAIVVPRMVTAPTAPPAVPGAHGSTENARSATQLGPSEGDAVTRVDSARGAALVQLAEQHGATCLQVAAVSVGRSDAYLAGLDTKIEAAHLPGQGWVEDGLWLGDRSSAIEAFAARRAYEDDWETWILVVDGNGAARAQQLVRLETPDGHVLWRTRNRATACTHDPSVDEGE